jgi:hypothetical protein
VGVGARTLSIALSTLSKPLNAAASAGVFPLSDFAMGSAPFSISTLHTLS